MSRVLQGERADTPVKTAEEFKDPLPGLLDFYEPRNVLNANEVGLFQEATGKKTDILKGKEYQKKSHRVANCSD